MRALLVVALALMAAPVARADDVDVQHWHNLFAQGRMKESRALWYLEVQPRASLLGGQGVVLLRGAAGFDLGGGLTLWAGAAGIPAYVAPHWTVGETRLWQQAMFVDKLGPLQLAWRGRFEQRAFDTREDPALRVRAMIRAVLDVAPDWGVVAFDEAFVGVLGRSGFDQNRAFVGLLHRLAPWFTVEGGYLFVQVGAPGADNARQLHTVLVQTTVNLL